MFSSWYSTILSLKLLMIQISSTKFNIKCYHFLLHFLLATVCCFYFVSNIIVILKEFSEFSLPPEQTGKLELVNCIIFPPKKCWQTWLKQFLEGLWFIITKVILYTLETIYKFRLVSSYWCIVVKPAAFLHSMLI